MVCVAITDLLVRLTPFATEPNLSSTFKISQRNCHRKTPQQQRNVKSGLGALPGPVDDLPEAVAVLVQVPHDVVSVHGSRSAQRRHSTLILGYI